MLLSLVYVANMRHACWCLSIWKLDLWLLSLIPHIHQSSEKLPVCSQMHSSPLPCFVLYHRKLCFPASCFLWLLGRSQGKAMAETWTVGEWRKKAFPPFPVTCDVPGNSCCFPRALSPARAPLPQGSNSHRMASFWALMSPSASIPPSLGNDCCFQLLLISGLPDYPLFSFSVIPLSKWFLY